MNKWSEGTRAGEEAVCLGSFRRALLSSAAPIRQI